MVSQKISISEARKLLGSDANSLTDDQIQEIINALSLIARDSLDKAKAEVRRKKDAKELAELIYDIYTNKKRSESK